MNQQQQRKSKNWLEWLVFGTGLLLVTAIAGYLIYQAITAPTGPPQIEITLGQPREEAGDYAIPVTVANHGHATAEHVQIQVTLTTSRGTQEQGAFQIQFLPHGAIRKGTVTFETNPAEARELKPRVLGYQRP